MTNSDKTVRAPFLSPVLAVAQVLRGYYELLASGLECLFV